VRLGMRRLGGVLPRLPAAAESPKAITVPRLLVLDRALFTTVDRR
jgi:hypothetical protein